jgi:hypothetical protein
MVYILFNDYDEDDDDVHDAHGCPIHIKMRSSDKFILYFMNNQVYNLTIRTDIGSNL